MHHLRVEDHGVSVISNVSTYQLPKPPKMDKKNEANFATANTSTLRKFKTSGDIQNISAPSPVQNVRNLLPVSASNKQKVVSSHVFSLVEKKKNESTRLTPIHVQDLKKKREPVVRKSQIDLIEKVAALKNQFFNSPTASSPVSQSDNNCNAESNDKNDGTYTSPTTPSADTLTLSTDSSYVRSTKKNNLQIEVPAPLLPSFQPFNETVIMQVTEPSPINNKSKERYHSPRTLPALQQKKFSPSAPEEQSNLSPSRRIKTKSAPSDSPKNANKVKGGSQQTIEIQIQDDDNSELEFTARIEPPSPTTYLFSPGSKEMFHSVFQDVKEQKKIELNAETSADSKGTTLDPLQHHFTVTTPERARSPSSLQPLFKNSSADALPQEKEKRKGPTSQVWEKSVLLEKTPEKALDISTSFYEDSNKKTPEPLTSPSTKTNKTPTFETPSSVSALEREKREYYQRKLDELRKKQEAELNKEGDGELHKRLLAFSFGKHDNSYGFRKSSGSAGNTKLRRGYRIADHMLDASLLSKFADTLDQPSSVAPLVRVYDIHRRDRKIKEIENALLDGVEINNL